MESLDCVVIGAGVCGLAYAKTYHQLHPDGKLAVLDAAKSLGGVWATQRLYPGLKTNNMIGMYEYPDFPLDGTAYGVKPGEHIPGEVLHEYLAAYAERFDIKDKIRYGCMVESAEHLEEGGWVLTVAVATNKEVERGGDKGNKREEGMEKKKMFNIRARRLVVAAGLTSDPFLPRIEGQQDFGPVYHGTEFLQQTDLLQPHITKNVVVFGGTKSAWDAVYACAMKGIKVDWVIRVTRLLTWFSPCIWGSADGYVGIRRFLHGTAVGRALTDAFWWVLGKDIVVFHKLDSHPELAKLKPWVSPMFVATSVGIHNWPTNFFDLVSGGDVRVHIADLTSLSKGRVHLADGTVLPCDALCCATGWKHVPSLRFLPEGIERTLGVPYNPSAAAGTESSAGAGTETATAQDNSQSEKLLLLSPERLAAADREILHRFPRLRNQPVLNPHSKTGLATPLLEQKGISAATAERTHGPHDSGLTPYALHRFVVPADADQLRRHRDIAFVGALMNFDVAVVSHAQALWIDAYFHDELPRSAVPPLTIPSPSSSSSEDEAIDGVDADAEADNKMMEELRYQTVLHSRFGKWRYPAARGAQLPDFVFDAVPYLDLLLGDLGLKKHRKGGRWAEVTQPYGPEDYRDIIPEWLATKKVGGA